MVVQTKKMKKDRIYSIRIDEEMYNKIEYIRSQTEYNIDIARSFRSMINEIYNDIKSSETNKKDFIYPEI
jgi:hypothetical protein